MGVGGQTPRPGRFTPVKDPVPLYRRLDDPTASRDGCGKISPPPGFDPRTVQPVSSRYTDLISVDTPPYIMRTSPS